MVSSLVSIALCTYNGEKYLPQQLDTLINQTYKNLEIVISDDNSTDSTVQIIKEYIERDPRITLIQNSENLGYNLNFENALKHCRGEFISISDQDDIWCLDKIETVMGAWENGVLLIYHPTARFEGFRAGQMINVVYGKMGSEFNDIIQLFDGNRVPGCTITVRRDIANKAMPFNPDLYYDWWLATVAASLGKVKFIKQSMIFHRRHHLSALYSKNTNSYFYSIVAIRCIYLKHVLDNLLLSDTDKAYATEMYNLYFKLSKIESSFLAWWLIVCNGKIFFPHKSNKTFPILSYMMHAYKRVKTLFVFN